MKVSRNTKDKIAAVKEDALRVAQDLQLLHTRLDEHPGTKRMSAKLQRVIDKLKEWQQSL